MNISDQTDADKRGQRMREMNSLASSMAGICSAMTGFQDSGLLYQMISCCGPHPVRIAKGHNACPFVLFVL